MTKKTAKKRPARSSKKPGPTPEATGPDYIAQGLWPLIVAIDSIDPLDRNPRTHGRESLRAIRRSLREFGQRKPIVVNAKNGQVEAGNGMLQAARRLGWEWIAVLYVEDDQQTQHGYAIADNRTAELSEWDDAILVELLAEMKTGAPELQAELVEELLLGDWIGPPPDQTAAERSEPTTTGVVSFNLVFDDAEQQQEWYRFLRWLRDQFPQAETHAARLAAYFDTLDF